MTIRAPSGMPAGLDEHYRPLVTGYLLTLTGNRDAARQLAGGLLTEVHAAGREHRWDPLSAARPSSSIAAELLLAATDRGLAYLRHARALQLAGVGGPAPVKHASHAAPTQWLRDAFERFRPPSTISSTMSSIMSSSIPRVPVRTAQARGEARVPAHQLDTPRLDTLRERPAARQTDNRRVQAQPTTSRDQVRRRVLRAVLADIPHEQARCLALHLVAGLSAPEVAWMLGIPGEVATSSVASGVAAVAVRYDHALEMLGLSPSLFERPLPRTPEPRIVAASSLAASGLAASSYSGTPTLRHRSAALPTQRLQPSQRPRVPLPTLPRAALPTLPAPQRTSSPSVVPVLTPRHMREQHHRGNGMSRRETAGPGVPCPRDRAPG